jgi:DNA-binding GntR family transcriptional regulator
MTKMFDYELVYNYILELIHDELHEHDKVPSESMLCDKFNLSRLTVRQGINKLKNEGYLYSKQGSGNFVSPKKITYKISPFTTFSNTMKKLNKEPKMKLLEKKIIKADENIAQKLSIREAEKVLYIKNMRLVDGVPFLYAEYYLNLLVLEDVEDKIETMQSFSQLYKEYNLEPIRDNSEIDITSTNYHSKKIFEIQNEIPIIKISTITIDNNTKKTIDYCYSYFRSDLAKIVIDYKEYKND